MGLEWITEDNLNDFLLILPEDAAENIGRNYYRGMALRGGAGGVDAALVRELKNAEEKAPSEAEITWLYAADRESGFYNLGYLELMREEEKAGRKKYGMAMVFETGGDAEKLAEILKQSLPQKADIVRISKQRFAFFSEGDSRGMCGFIRESVQEEAAEKGIDVSIEEKTGNVLE
ncbi:MAG: hypothetical protein K6F35_08795 [Lachnospiraceae bacterium]|nr:hypothetical protein [Lachnospiraceae bacterium]